MTEVLAEGGLRLDRDGAVVRLTLSRPAARNALTLAMWQGIDTVAAALAADASARVLVISGEGEKAFSAGADIAEFPETYATPESTAAYNATVRRAQAAIADLPFPVIAAVRGACFGGGCGLALHSDLRFASLGSCFAVTPARLGLAYSFADTRRLVALVGPARAKDILFSGRTLEADEALSIGLIDWVIPDEKLDQAVETYAGGLASLSQTSIRIAKAMIDTIAQGAAEPTPELEQAFQASFSGADFKEGYAAFMEKRKPDFG